MSLTISNVYGFSHPVFHYVLRSITIFAITVNLRSVKVLHRYTVCGTVRSPAISTARSLVPQLLLVQLDCKRVCHSVVIHPGQDYKRSCV